jgi:hypothetical protein
MLKRITSNGNQFLLVNGSNATLGPGVSAVSLWFGANWIFI